MRQKIGKERFASMDSFEFFPEVEFLVYESKTKAPRRVCITVHAELSMSANLAKHDHTLSKK